MHALVQLYRLLRNRPARCGSACAEARAALEAIIDKRRGQALAADAERRISQIAGMTPTGRPV